MVQLSVGIVEIHRGIILKSKLGSGTVTHIPLSRTGTQPDLAT